jgi:hypothetical protein
MKEKELEDYTYEELINKLTGEAIMSLGRGDSFRRIVANIAFAVNMWTYRTTVEKKGVGKVKKNG